MFNYISLSVLLAVTGYVQGAVQASARDALCKARNGYYPLQGECDGYIDCRDYRAIEMLCPDGLHFNPNAIFPEYPCSYPTEVSCEGRGAPQPAKPTRDCPHQYGFFASPAAHSSNCGLYRMCIEGQAVEMQCAPGLAFNSETARCDWPDLVPGCKAEDFLGFTCPPAPLGEDGEPLELVNYPHHDDCYAFYSCTHGRPRLLTCDAGYSFDVNLGHCVDADLAVCYRSGQL